MEVMVVDMVDTDMDVNADPLMLTMDMAVMVDTVMDMVDTDMAVNHSSLIFIVPKNHKKQPLSNIPKKNSDSQFLEPRLAQTSHIYRHIPHKNPQNQCR